MASKLDGSVGADLIAEVKAVHDDVEAAELILAPEPPGRAHSQPAFDARSGRIVLFGGNGLDRCYADTWLYDPKTRSWEQRWPKVSPSPRAGHALVYLPKSGKIALAGGYTIDGWFREIPHQVWIYDVAQNEWKPLLSVPLGPRGKPSPDFPAGGAGGNWSGGGSPWAGAVTEGDILVMVDTFSAGRRTWACRVDPSTPAADTKDLPGVPPGSMSFSRQPDEWEKTDTLEPKQVLVALENLQPNVWTALKPPKGVDHRAWNTTAYDADRHQLLWWGGGHVTYMGTDVAHYSVRANRWTIGYAPDLPTEPTGGFYVKASLSFRDRPQIPVHAYQAYAYDPPSGKMFYLDRAYDVSTREWDLDPYPGLNARGAMHTLLETTPHGVVALSEKGLYRFVWQEQSWKKLPWNGPSFGGAWCDGHALCYDSKRDCLWMAHKNIFRYDMKTGAVEKLDVVQPKRLGQWALWREQVHIPEADLILLMRRFKIEGGRETNVAFDPESKKYYEVELEFEGGKPRELSWSAALHYDGKLGIAILHDGFSGVWALKFDRKSAKMREIVE
ncbi:MAG: kelch repeat-containing protein [Kiritimatiellia bacterium]